MAKTLEQITAEALGAQLFELLKRQAIIEQQAEEIAALKSKPPAPPEP